MKDQPFVIVGKSTDSYVFYDGSQKTRKVLDVSIMSIPDAIEDIGKDFENKGLVSLDGIFAPYTTSFETHGSLPHFTPPESGYQISSLTLNPFNPNNVYGFAVTGDSGVWDGSGDYALSGSGQPFYNQQYYDSGHTIQLANTLNEVGNNTNGDLSFVKDLYDNNEIQPSAVQSVGLRGPLVLSGWGRNLDGYPVPADPNDKTKYLDGAFEDPTLWKTGPVDLRWDESRGVWTGGGPLLRHGTVVQHCDESCNIYLIRLVDRRFTPCELPITSGTD